MQRKSKWPKDVAEDDPVLASQDLEGKNDTPSKAASKALPEEKVSRMGLAWGYSVGVVQGKDVTSVLNAPINFLTALMRKDP